MVTRNFGSVFGSDIFWVAALDDLLAGETIPQDTPAKAPEELRRMRGEDTHLA